MENQHKNHHTESETRKSESLKDRKTERQNPSNPVAGSETIKPQDQTPEQLRNQKLNKDQVTNKDSDPSGSRDPKKQDNTVTSPDRKDKTLTSKPGSTMTDTKKQQNHNVDGSVFVEDEDEAAVISDDVEK